MQHVLPASKVCHSYIVHYESVPLNPSLASSFENATLIWATCPLALRSTYSRDRSNLALLQAVCNQCLSTSSIFSQFITIMALIRFPFKSTCLMQALARQSAIPATHQEQRKEWQGNSHSVELVTLNTHVPRAQMLYAPPAYFHRHRLLENHECLIPLANKPLVRLLLACRVGRHEQSRPERTFACTQIRELRCRRLEDRVEPVERGLQVEVVPKAVAENEGVGFGGFGAAEEFAEAGKFFGADGEANHLFDCGVLARDREKRVMIERKIYSSRRWCWLDTQCCRGRS